MTKKKWIALIALTLCVLSAVVYVNDYYRADWEMIGSYPSTPGVRVEERDDGLAFIPENTEAGFLFYPGGKVEYKAYIPLMEALAEQNVLCVLLEMPLNLAVLDVNAAEGVAEDYAEVDRWYIGGHSLGGSMAASYAAEHSEELEGLVLLAAYSTTDLKDSGLEILSLYGSEDGVLNMEKYEKYRDNLSKVIESEISGGNHAGFGMYGAQEGDGTATITNEEQIAETAAWIVTLMEE